MDQERGEVNLEKTTLLLLGDNTVISLLMMFGKVKLECLKTLAPGWLPSFSLETKGNKPLLPASLLLFFLLFFLTFTGLSSLPITNIHFWLSLPVVGCQCSGV